MKIKHQLSVATLVMAGVFATGCSQQVVEGGSQVAGGQQVAGGAQVAGGQQVAGGEQVAGGQQVAGGEQVAGGQQVAGGEQVAGGQQVAGGTQVAGGQQAAGGQQVADTQEAVTVAPKMVDKAPVMAPKKPVMAPKKPVMAPKPAGNCHGHAPTSLSKTVRHCHRNPTGKHTQKGKTMAKKHPVKTVTRVVEKKVYVQVPKVVYKEKIVYKPVYVKTPAPAVKKPMVAKKPMAPRNRWCHGHAANSLTKSVSHCHKYNQSKHSHAYGGKVAVKRMAPKVMAPRVMAPKAAPAPKPVDVFALQTKLKAKGYYKGPIDGVVGKGTRAALNQFMQNR